VRLGSVPLYFRRFCHYTYRLCVTRIWNA